MQRPIPAIIAAIALITSALCAQTPLPRDDQNVYGQFDNGLRYIVRRTTNPPGRFSAYLHIEAGALHETAAQNGIAHFVEHMAFNGSEHYAPGELIPALNELGMEFGADSNAHTGLDETVYKLHLPENDDAMLERALVILGDFAHRLQMRADEIEKERSVILEENRARKGLQQRIGEEIRARLFASSRLAIHDVIGTEEAISGFPREEFVDYWDTWYRPELMTLIVVGDLDPETVIAKARPQLGEFEARADAREYVGAQIKPFAEPVGIVLSDPEVVQASVQIVSIREGGEPAKTVEDAEHRLAERVATAITSRRLNDLVQKGEAEYLGAGVGVDTMLGEITQSAAYAAGDAKRWKPILDQVLAEVQRVLEHGFRARELELVRAEVLAGARRAVETEPTLDATALVDRFSSAVGEGRVLMSAQQRLDLIEAAFEKLTLEDLHQAFKAAFDSRAYAYVLVMPEEEGIDLPTEAEVVAAADAAWGRETEVRAEDEAATSLLEELPEPGAVVSREFHEGLGVATVRFENGVVMRHRFMDYRKDSAIIAAHLPGGALEETAENHGVSEVASLVGATSRLTSLQIRDLMAGVNADVGIGVGAEAVAMTVGGDPQDLETGAQLLYALLRDGRVEPTAFDTWKEAKLRSIETAPRDLQAQFGESMASVLFGGDLRFLPLEKDEVERLSAEQGDAWLRELLDGAPLEVAVVGDISEADATAIVARYFGSLPEADRGFDSLDSLRTIPLPEIEQIEVVEVETVTPQALVLAGFRGCDREQTDDRRLLSLAARILSDRIRVRIREELGLVYSMQCDSRSAQAVHGTGLVMAVAPTDPAKADELARETLALMQELAENGPTEAELDVARKQARTALENAVEQPGFWVDALSTLNTRGRTLAEFEDVESVYDSYTVQQVQETVKRYFVPERAITVIAKPK